MRPGKASCTPSRTLGSHASRMRRKLNASAETSYVLNVWVSATG
jgi:hypothetical protein